MAQLLYNIGIWAYHMGISMAALFSDKAKQWRSGRVDWEQSILQAMADVQQPIVWLHAASLGEFEQGRPIIEGLRTQNSELFIVLTFFSPSGYEVRKNYSGADLVMYMPLDTRSNAKRFLELLNPSAAIFVKYEFWFNHLQELEQREVPTYLVSGRIHPRQVFFKPYGAWFRKRLTAFSFFYVQNEESKELLASLGIKRVLCNGDTRFDRVIEIKEQSESIPEVAQFVEGADVVVVGSSWPAEEEMVLDYLNDQGIEAPKLIIAPHDIKEERLREIERKSMQSTVRLSRWTAADDAQVLIVDSIGKLAAIYRYARLAIVGGGFGAGIHNVLEPAIWALPVLFGPKYKGFGEAVDLIAAGGAQSFRSPKELNELLTQILSNQELRTKMADASEEFCRANTGATTPVLEAILSAIADKIS